MSMQEQLPEIRWRENYRDYTELIVGTALYLSIILTVTIAFISLLVSGALLLESLYYGNHVGSITYLSVWVGCLVLLFGVQWFTFRYTQ